MGHIPADNVSLAFEKICRSPGGCTPKAFIPITFLSSGYRINACVSPPQLNTSHMVQTAASIAQEASTALPRLSEYH
jgi:hypothetical protein